MAKQMKTTHAPKRESATIVISTTRLMPRMPIEVFHRLAARSGCVPSKTAYRRKARTTRDAG